MATNLLTKYEWVAEWQKKLPLNFWLNLKSKGTGHYPDEIWLSIGDKQHSPEKNYQFVFANIQGSPARLDFDYLESPRIPKEIKDILINTWQATVKEIPKFSATPSKQFEVVFYWEQSSINGDGEGKCGREVILRSKSLSSCHSLLKKYPNAQIEHPDGTQEIFDYWEKDIIKPSHVLPYA